MIAGSVYSMELKTPENEAFVKAFRAEYGKDSMVDFENVAGWNGMAGIFQVVKKLGAKATGDAAMEVFKGMKLVGPNGPVEIDPDTRDIIQNVYLSKVEKHGDEYVNAPFATIPNVKDAWKELNPK
jgi:branched-chain amino acid transport system substrate-binding protein